MKVLNGMCLKYLHHLTHVKTCGGIVSYSFIIMWDVHGSTTYSVDHNAKLILPIYISRHWLSLREHIKLMIKGCLVKLASVHVCRNIWGFCGHAHAACWFSSVMGHLDLEDFMYASCSTLHGCEKSFYGKSQQICHSKSSLIWNF